MTPLTASWHNDYADSAYIYLGGLNYRMNEGDLVTVASQFGEVVDCRLARDRKTGKPRGFAFLAYEDQRSTVLAVDNLNGIELCGRTILCDHVKQYKIPREFMYLSDSEEDEKKAKDRKDKSNVDGDPDNEESKEHAGKDGSDSEDDEEDDEEAREAKARERWEKKLYKPTGPDGHGWGDFRKVTPQEEIILDELLKLERHEAKRKEKLIMLDAMKAEKLNNTQEPLAEV